MWVFVGFVWVLFRAAFFPNLGIIFEDTLFWRRPQSCAMRWAKTLQDPTADQTNLDPSLCWAIDQSHQLPNLQSIRQCVIAELQAIVEDFQERTQQWFDNIPLEIVGQPKEVWNRSETVWNCRKAAISADPTFIWKLLDIPKRSETGLKPSETVEKQRYLLILHLYGNCWTSQRGLKQVWNRLKL